MPFLIENNFWRGAGYIKNGLALFKKEANFLDFYRGQNLKARLYYHGALYAKAAPPFAGEVIGSGLWDTIGKENA